MPPGTIFGGYEAYAQCAGRATRPGGVKSLEGDGSETAREAFSRAGSKSVQIGEDRGSARGESRLQGTLGPVARDESSASAGRRGPKRINPEAFLQGGCPPQSPRLPEPFLPQKCKHRIVCLALHTRREQTEVTNVVPVAVGHVMGERGQERRRRVRGLDGAFRARVLRHKPDFLTADRPEPVLRDGRPSGISARVPQELLLAAEPRVLEALGHSFFTLSLGLGAMVTYGSYLAKTQSIVKASAIIVVLDTAVSNSRG